MTEEELRAIVALVTPAPSCVDMGWEWDIVTVYKKTATMGFDPTLSVVEAGFLIRCSFRRPDTNTGEIGRGFGRFYHLNVDETPTGVAKTMILAMTRIVDHEVVEMFRFDGERIFDPHFDIDDLEAALKHRKKKVGV